MVKTKLTLSIEEDVVKDFKKLCIDNEDIVSDAVQTFMETKIKNAKR